MVVPGGVELEVSQERSAGRDDPDVLVVGEDEDGLSGVAAADSDVVQAAVVALCEFPVGVDGVVPDAVVALGEGLAAGSGLGSRGVGLLRGAPAQCPVRSAGVVVVAEGVELALEANDGRGGRAGRQVLLDGLVDAFDLPAGLRVVGA